MKEVETETDKKRKFVIIDAQTNARGRESSALIENSPKLGASSYDRPSSQQATSFDKTKLEQVGVIYPGMKDKEVLNAYRSLRLKLQSKMEQFNSVILISPVGKKGSSAIAALNLAVAFTLEHENHALLIDFNSEREDLLESLGVDENGGMYEFLAGSVTDFDNIVYPTTVPRLSIMPAGKSYSAEDEALEYWGGDKIETLMSDIKAQRQDRVIIINTPSILASADTKLLAEFSDYVVLALPYGRMTPMQINKTVNEFGKDQVAGFVMMN